MSKQAILLKILHKLSPDDAMGVTLGQAVKQIETFNKIINIQPVLDAVSNIEKAYSKKTDDLSKEVISEIAELKGLLQKEIRENADKQIEEIKSSLSGFASTKDVSLIKESFKERLFKVSKIQDSVDTLSEDFKILKKGEEIIKLQEALDELRKDLISRMSNLGGGAPNQQINVNSSVMSTKYADFNFISDSVIEWSASDDDTNKRVNISASVITSGGAGGLSILAATGTINDSNKDFTFTTEPSAIIINGGLYQKTGGAITWTFAGSTATLSSAVGTGGSIFGLT